MLLQRDGPVRIVKKIKTLFMVNFEEVSNVLVIGQRGA
jgi:hypothetical protein